MKFTLVLDKVDTPQEIVNALGCVSGQVLLANKLHSKLVDGPHMGELVDANEKTVGSWTLS